MSIPAWDPEVYGEPVYTDALIDPEVYGEAPLAEEEAAGGEGSFTADAVLFKTQSGSLTAAAVLSKVQVGSLTSDATLRRSQAGSLTADAVIFRSQSASITADSWILRVVSASLTADAVLMVNRTASFTAEAWIAVFGASSFSINAVLLGSQSAILAADAVVLRSSTASLTADAVLGRTQTGSFTADAVLLQAQSASLTADAVLVRSQSGSLTADAARLAGLTATFTADAYTSSPGFGSLTADSTLLRVQASSFTAAASVVGSSSGSFTANATVKRTQTASLTADAIHKVTVPHGTISISASALTQVTLSLTTETAVAGLDINYRQTPLGSVALTWSVRFSHYQPGQFKHEALHLKRDNVSGATLATSDPQGGGGDNGDATNGNQFTASGSYTDTSPTTGHYILSFGAINGAAAIYVITRSFSATAPPLTANAVKLKVISGSFTANSTRRRVQEASFTADAILQLTFSANAIKFKEQSASFTANAVLRASQSGSFTADGAWGYGGTFTASAILLKTFSNVLTGGVPTVVASASAIKAWNSGSSLSIATPTGTQNGDLMLAIMASDPQLTTRVITPPAGWTQLSQIQTVAGDRNYNTIFSKTASSEGATQVFAWGSPDTGYLGGMAGGIVTFRDAGSPLVITGNALNPVTSSHVTGTLVSIANSLIGVAFSGGVNVSTSWTPPSGFTELWDRWTQYVAHEAAYRSDLTTAGTKGPYTATYSGSFSTISYVYAVPPLTNQGIRAYAYIVRNVTQTLTADAVIAPKRFRADAIVRASQSGSLTADAWFAQGGTFTVDAAKVRTTTGSFTANAAFAASVTATFTANASVRIIQTGSFTANATFGRGGTFTVAAAIYATLAATFTIGANIVGEREIDNNLPPGRPPLDLFIRVDGVEITDYVKFATCRFVSSSSGRPGEFEMEIVDKARLFNILPNSTVTVDMGGQRVFAGYASFVTRGYAFDVDDTTDPADVERVWRLSGPDINILMLRRVVWNKASPTSQLHRWPKETTDKTIIDYAVTNYTVLLNEDDCYLDTTLVDSPGRDKAFATDAGITFADFMGYVARNTGGVYWIAPDGAIRYEDDDTEDAPFRLSDRPDNRVNYVGFAPLTMSMDGSQLINDALVWGAGTGKPTMTFSRTQDSASRASHNRWQEGDMRFNAYKQATVDRIADSFVYGSPQNLRGHKDDRRIWRARLFEPGLTVGMKVKMESEVFGVESVIPIRRMALTFPTPYDPAFEIEISHELDPAWSFSEWMPVPDYDPGKGGTPEIEGGGDPPVPGECECGITDSFSRITYQGAAGGSGDADWPDAQGWGQADMGLTWNRGSGDNYGQAYQQNCWVDGEKAVHMIGFSNYFSFQSMHWGYDHFAAGPLDVVTEMSVDKVLAVGVDPNFDAGESIGFFLGFALGNGGSVYTEIGRLGGGTYLYMQSNVSPFPDDYVLVPFDETQPFSIHWTCAGAGSPVYCTVWQSSDPEPVTPTLSISSLGGLNYVFDRFDSAVNTTLDYPPTIGATGTPFHVYMHSLDIDGISRCSATQFDNFDRTVAAGSWGTATPSGLVWGPTGVTATSVDGSKAKVTAPSTAQINPGQEVNIPIGDPAPWVNSPTYQMRSKFRITSVGSASTDYGTIFFEIGSDGLTTNKYEMVEMRVSSNAAVGHCLVQSVTLDTGGDQVSDLVEVVKTDWVANVDYNVLWEIESGVATRLKVWLASAAEPSTWLVENTSANVYDATFASHLTVGFILRGTTGRAFLIDGIDFDYEGRPCSCGDVGVDPVIEDTFTRTTGPLDLGTADTGQVWTDFRNGVTPVATIETTGSSAHFLIPHPTALDLQADDAGSTLTSSYMAGHVVVAFRLKVNSQDLSIDEITPFIDIGFGAADWNLEFGGPAYSGSTRTHGQRLQVVSFGSSPNNATIFDYALTTGVWYRTKLENDPGNVTRLKIWVDGEDEPDQWTISTTAVGQNVGAPYDDDFSLYVEQGGSDNVNLGEDLDIEIDDLQIGPPGSSDCNVVVDVPPVLGMGGTVCENGYRLDSTHYQLSTLISPDTSEVHVNGALYWRGVDYTELDDQIVFTWSVDTFATVYVCYRSVA